MPGSLSLVGNLWAEMVVGLWEWEGSSRGTSAMGEAKFSFILFTNLLFHATN